MKSYYDQMVGSLEITATQFSLMIDIKSDGTTNIKK